MNLSVLSRTTTCPRHPEDDKLRLNSSESANRISHANHDGDKRHGV